MILTYCVKAQITLGTFKHAIILLSSWVKYQGTVLYEGLCSDDALTDKLITNAIATGSRQIYSSGYSISHTYSKSGADAQACLWGNGYSHSTVSVLWLLIQVGKIVSECWEAEGVCLGVWPVRAVWAPECPEVVTEAGGSSRLSGTSRAARRPIQWLFNGFSFHYKLMNAVLRSETLPAVSGLKRHNRANYRAFGFHRPAGSFLLHRVQALISHQHAIYRVQLCKMHELH